MRNLTNVLKALSLLFLFVCNFHSQENKYTKRNKSAKIIQYTTDKCYSRSILIKDSIVYTANSNGTLYATNIHGGYSYNILGSQKYEELRDLAYCNGFITAMQSGTYGVLVQTDGKKFTQNIQPENGMWNKKFLDGMDFKDSIGFLMGDPIDSIFSLYKSNDYGQTWQQCESNLKAFDGEAGFAASGTNVQVLKDSCFVFISGGKKSRYFRSNDAGKTWSSTSLPYMTSETNGAFSIYMINESDGVIVGGDYKNPYLCLNTCFFTDDGGKFWMNAETQTRGYRSCTHYKNDVLYACGTNGIDFSTDKGKNWKPFMNGTYMAMCTDNCFLYATMPNGSFQIFELISKK